jgi:arylsulfatase A-like enzyme
VNQTLCDLAGIPGLEHVDARSFAPALRNGASEHRECAVSMLPRLRIIRTKSHKYVVNYNNENELYDLGSDPGEQHNCAGENRDLCRELDWMLRKRLCQPTYGAMDN